VVSRSHRASRVTVFSYGTQMVTRIQKSSIALQNSLLVKVLRHGCARRIPLLTKLETAPLQTVIVKDHIVHLLQNAHPTPETIIREFAPSVATDNRDQPLGRIPLTGC